MKKIKYFIVATSILLLSCEKFVEVDPPKTMVTSTNIFSTDADATAAVFGIYSTINLGSPLFFNGGITIYTGLTSDELVYTGTTANILEFNSNSISATNSTNSGSFWGRAYSLIYQINACIEGIKASNKVSPAVRSQLLGECLFLRAFWYHYLVGLYGDVPLIKDIDYEVNAQKPRAAAMEVKKQILNDLLEAESLLSINYPSVGRTRPNKWVVNAFLARYYLYEKDWINAEKYASAVINSGSYSLVNNLNNVFLANSSEAILQIPPSSTGYNTYEGNTLIPASAASSKPTYALTNNLFTSFQAGDQRRTAWINSKTVSGITYNYPYKYKIPFISGSSNPTEYYMLIRLAELYLVRAEARVQVGSNLLGAQADLNTIRNRAGLSNTNSNSASALQNEIEQEYRVEFFAEWGHRWFDLKRWDKANTVLSPIKLLGWQNFDVLWPIPQSEILLNQNLSQNLGY